MSILIQIGIILCAVKTFSYAKWCFSYDKKNIIGNISIFLLGVILLGICVFLLFK